MRRQIKKGQRFRRLVVTGKPLRKGHDRVVPCKCDCGNRKKSVLVSSLFNKDTKSCGCLRKEVMSKRQRTHGQSKTRLYRVWALMIQRCEDRNVTAYESYGGRGIKVCKSWHKFVTFSNWADRSGYSSNLTLDRKDNNSGYRPGNCQWATRTLQSRNRRKRSGCSSKYIGVSKAGAKWVATITINRIYHHIGTFKTAKAAAIARDDVARKHPGYMLNFPKRKAG